MPYEINRYNGSQISTIADGTIDSTTSLKLIGKNYAGYGEAQNENFLHLLENFSNATAPISPISGQLWYNSSEKRLHYYDGNNKWKSASGAEVNDTEPLGLTRGDLWFNKKTKQLYVHNGVNYTLVGPDVVENFGATQFRSRNVRDISNALYPIIECIIDDQTIYIVSKSAFTIESNQIVSGGFTDIKQGLTLVNTPSDGVTTSYHRYWGTASNSLKLNGLSSSDFIRSENSVFNNIVKFKDVGYTVGNDSDLAVYIDTDGTTPVIKNAVSSTIRFQTTSSGIKYALEIFERDLLPGYDPTGLPTTGVNNIGSSTRKFNIVYSNIFEGNSTGANKLKVNNDYRDATTTATANTIAARNSDGDLYARIFNGVATSATSATSATGANTLLVNTAYRQATTTATANTIAARDSDGDLYARIFNGVATSARFADLAEKYLADDEYGIGTVLVIGGSAEVTKSSLGQRAIGVVSSHPAYLMNSHLENGTLVAIKGRVPVKVTGPVKKGDKLIASNDGLATKAIINVSEVFAIVLESSDDHDVKLIESVIL
jgi:hypothetical protein